MKAMKRLCVLAAVCAMVASVAQANVVSWNFDYNGSVGNWDGSYNSNMVAGVVPVVGWNNSYWANPVTDLVDNTGGATTIDISYSSPTAYSIYPGHPGQDMNGTWNKELLNGYMNAGVAGWTTQSVCVVTLSEIVAEGASYDIYVYFSCDVAGRTGVVTDKTTVYYFNTLGPASITDASGNAVFALASATDTNGFDVAANYAVFSGLTGSSQTIISEIPAWGGIAGIQVVGVVPEPAAIGLVSVFGLGVLFVRRRFRI